ncbi:MAG: nitroreductase family protein [Peptostreptococcaceae bacterium]
MIRNYWYESQKSRKSTRTYIDKVLEEKHEKNLKNLIKEINEEVGFKFQLINNCQNLFKGFKASYGLLQGVNSCIALVSDKSISQYKNKIGYYGEMLVLEAEYIGVSTCWIGGTYDKRECQKYINISDNEEIVCLIVIGYSSSKDGLIQKIVSNANKRRKSFGNILLEEDDLPKWVISGINCVMLSPSALNNQPIGYTYKNDVVSAYTTMKNHGFEDTDLGISMLHFEVGAMKEGKKGKWKYLEGRYEYNLL